MNKEALSRAKKVGVVVQTTIQMKAFKALVPSISALCYELRVFNTICSTTSKRQEQAKELAKEVEFMIIIGDKHSSNSNQLAQICKTININSVMVQDLDELKQYDLSKFKHIGITAGASTPTFVIDKIMEYLNLNKGETYRDEIIK